jgi:hypothetical protein
MQLAGQGHAIPPLGFVVDVIHLTRGFFPEPTHAHHPPELPVDHTLIRQYDDYVIGKMLADHSFERSTDALARYQGRDLLRGQAFVIQQMLQRCEYRGVHVSPAIFKSLIRQTPNELKLLVQELVAERAVSAELLDDYRQLIGVIRQVGNLLGGEDIFELEHGTAIAEFGQRLALRQVLQTSETFSGSSAQQILKPQKRREQVATRIRDEDYYPVGGFTSISTRGTIESLLHSQLAFMELDDADRPDLFDIKFLRDELLYYARDENQFFRRRKTILFVFYPQLIETRIKDAQLPYQRMIVLLGMLHAAVGQLSQWLSNDALAFHFLFVDHAGQVSLQDERMLCETLLREQIANGTVFVDAIAYTDVASRADQFAVVSETHLLALLAADRSLECKYADVAKLIVSSALPELHFFDEQCAEPDNSESALDSWKLQFRELLASWL